MAGYNPSFTDCDGPWKETKYWSRTNWELSKQRLAEEIFRFVQGPWREFSSLVSSWLTAVQHFTMQKVKGNSKFLVTCFQLTRVVLPEYLFKAQTFLLDKHGEDTHKLKNKSSTVPKDIYPNGKRPEPFSSVPNCLRKCRRKEFPNAARGLTRVFHSSGNRRFFWWISYG